jgi:hypothetical protein
LSRSRVFDIANIHKLDVNTVLAFLDGLGEQGLSATSLLASSADRRIRAALVGVRSGDRPTPARIQASQSTRAAVPFIREQRVAAVRQLIPPLYQSLLASGIEKPDSPIVVFHESKPHSHYGVRTISDPEWVLSAGLDARLLVAPLRELDSWYHKRDRTPPTVYIAIDIRNGHAWSAHSLKAIQNNLNAVHLDAQSLAKIPTRGEGLPPRLSRAPLIAPEQANLLARSLGDRSDRPEETFLLSQDLLRLAVDSLDGAEQLDPPPIHINALWVFERPVVMQRPDGSDRHIRALWFRQGQAVWRLRTYALATGKTTEQLGDQLAGRLPFIPTWDETHPEQQVIAAVWALMSQGGVTESNHERGTRLPSEQHPEEHPEKLIVVRVKAGTDHARVYGADNPTSQVHSASAWSVSGHWRRQPYRSLGLDEVGNVRTRPLWIAQYTKGNTASRPPEDKVISVRA